MLDFAVGDEINLGASSLQAMKVLTYEPDRGGDMFNIAPRLLMNLADLEATGLIRPGSRATYRLLVAGSGNAVAGFRTLIGKYEEYDIRGIRDARPELRTALDRAEQFLGLAVLVSIALAGLAVALSAQRYAVRHFDNCAIMRCFGAGQDTIIKIYFIQLLILALFCSGIGCVLGYLGQAGLTVLMRGLVSRPLPEPTLTPVLIGMSAGVLTVLGFAMPQILRLKNVTPLRVLRRDLIPLPLRQPEHISGRCWLSVIVDSVAIGQCGVDPVWFYRVGDNRFIIVSGDPPGYSLVEQAKVRSRRCGPIRPGEYRSPGRPEHGANPGYQSRRDGTDPADTDPDRSPG